MTIEPYNYSIFFEFIETYLPSGFRDIKADDAIMHKWDEVLEINNQYVSIFEMEQLKLLFTSRGSLTLNGEEASELNPASYFEVVHPDEIYILLDINSPLFSLPSY